MSNCRLEQYNCAVDVKQGAHGNFLFTVPQTSPHRALNIKYFLQEILLEELIVFKVVICGLRPNKHDVDAFF